MLGTSKKVTGILFPTKFFEIEIEGIHMEFTQVQFHDIQMKVKGYRGQGIRDYIKPNLFGNVITNDRKNRNVNNTKTTLDDFNLFSDITFGSLNFSFIVSINPILDFLKLKNILKLIFNI